MINVIYILNGDFTIIIEIFDILRKIFKAKCLKIKNISYIFIIYHYYYLYLNIHYSFFKLINFF